MPTDKELLDAFSRLSQAWDIERSGIITSFNGARVASWNWNKRRMLVNPETDDFRKLFRRLNKNGVLKRIPSKKLGKEPTVDNTVLVTVPVSQSTPGELDHTLKGEGYYLIDLNVPVVRD
jgi:hypothetical protein